MGDSAGGPGKLDAVTTMHVWNTMHMWEVGAAMEYNERKDKKAEEVAGENGITKEEVLSIVRKTTHFFKSFSDQQHVDTNPFLQAPGSMRDVPLLRKEPELRKSISRLPVACRKEIHALHTLGKSVDEIIQNVQAKFNMTVTTTKVRNEIARKNGNGALQSKKGSRSTDEQSDHAQASTLSAAQHLPTQSQNVDAAHAAGAVSNAPAQPPLPSAAPSAAPSAPLDALI